LQLNSSQQYSKAPPESNLRYHPAATMIPKD
jgi:hypothetical protein